MANPSSEKVYLPSSKAIQKGVQWFLFFTVTGVIVALWWKSSANLGIIIRNLDKSYLLLLIPLLAIDYLLGGLRMRLFFDGKVLPKISLWDNMRGNWANIFMGAVTPFQTGGGPAQLYILWRCGAKISESTLITIINFAATLIFFQVASIVALLILPADIFGHNLIYAIKIAFAMVGTLTGGLLLIMLFPQVGMAVIEGLVWLIPSRFTKAHALGQRMLNVLKTGSEHFGAAFRQILRHKKKALLATVIATLALFFNKYLMGYVIALALQQDAPFQTFIGLQILHFFLIYFAPTPGASGIAEVSSVWLMEKVMSSEVLIIYAVAWRFFSTHLGAIIGGVVLLFETRALAKPTLAPAAQEHIADQ